MILPTIDSVTLDLLISIYADPIRRYQRPLDLFIYSHADSRDICLLMDDESVRIEDRLVEERYYAGEQDWLIPNQNSVDALSRAIEAQGTEFLYQALDEIYSLATTLGVPGLKSLLASERPYFRDQCFAADLGL